MRPSCRLMYRLYEGDVVDVFSRGELVLQNAIVRYVPSAQGESWRERR